MRKLPRGGAWPGKGRGLQSGRRGLPGSGLCPLRETTPPPTPRRECCGVAELWGLSCWFIREMGLENLSGRVGVGMKPSAVYMEPCEVTGT